MVVKPNKSGGAYAKSGYTDLQGKLLQADERVRSGGGREAGGKSGLLLAF